jgi:steroid 5-alpha reductase family enzyme
LTGGGLTPTDIVFAVGIVALVVVEFISDQQQWDYQNAKKEYQKTARVPKGWKREDLDRGFNTTGLFAYSRHPNFGAEQSVWVMFYLWACAISETTYNWTAVGAIGYLALFQGSTWFTESITAGKYAEYRDYQRQVGMFVPTPGSGWSPVAKSQEKADELKKSK